MPAPPPAPKNLEEVAAVLTAIYSDFDHYNRKNPLEELLFILCSVKTSENSYRRVYKDFRKTFPTFGVLAEAPAEKIAEPLVSGGLYRQKSEALRRTMDAIIERFGTLTLAPLKSFPDEQCERFLTSLPGVGLKVARCVMMYSLGRAVFSGRYSLLAHRAEARLDPEDSQGRPLHRPRHGTPPSEDPGKPPFQSPRQFPLPRP